MRVSPRLIAVAMLASLTAASSAQAVIVYGLTDENDLLSFDSSSPEDLISANVITGLASNDDLIGIDFRPANNLLYGVGDQGNIYTINTSTGAATLVSVITGATLSGSRFGVDFNPVADRLRIVSDLDQNLRIDVATGVATVDLALNYANNATNISAGAFGDNPNVTAGAYTNSFGPSPRVSPGTTLYDIDVRTTEDRLVIQSPPNNGDLTVVGSLGVNASSLNGFDIYYDGVNNIGVAALQLTAGGTSELYSIDLSTGVATPLGAGIIGGGDILDGITVVPEPAGLALLGMTLGGLLLRRRRA